MNIGISVEKNIKFAIIKTYMLEKEKKLPEFLNKYFWDIDKLNFNKYPVFTIERILEYGDEDAVKWVLKNFKLSQIKQTLMRRKGISPKSATYWSLLFNVPKNKITCLKKSYRKMQKSHWLS